MNKSILANAAVASGGRVINVILGIIVTALVTRLLGPSDYGLYILIMSFGVIVQLFADFGLYLTLTKQIARESTSKLFSEVMSLRLALLAVTFVLGAFLLKLFQSGSELTFAFIIAAVGLSAQSLSQLIMGVFQHHQTVWRATAGDLLGRAIQIMVIVLFGILLTSINIMVFAFTAGAIISLVFHYRLLPNYKWRPHVNLQAWRKLAFVSWPLGAMLLLNAIFFRVDTVILSLFNSSEQVGYYGLAYRIIESLLFFPAMLGGLLLPRISQALTTNKSKASKYINEGLKILVAAGSLVLLTVFIWGSALLQIIGGKSFVSAIPLLEILIVAAAIIFIGNLFGFSLVALDKPFALLKLYLFLAIINLIGNLIFIPIYGASAAAWTTVLTELASTTTAGIIVYRTLPFQWPYKITVLTAALAFVSFGIVRLTLNNAPEFISLIVATTILVGGHIIFGSFSKKEIPLLRGVL